MRLEITDVVVHRLMPDLHPRAMGWREPLFTEPVTIDAGCVVLSDKPGIGCGLSQASLQRYRV